VAGVGLHHQDVTITLQMFNSIMHFAQAPELVKIDKLL
jgi:hypothetical protein